MRNTGHGLEAVPGVVNTRDQGVPAEAADWRHPV